MTAARLTNPDPLNRGIPLVQEGGIVLLGSPIGSKVFEKQAIEERMNKVKELCSRLALMKYAQSEYVLLRSCLSIPKIMFTLRTTDPLHRQGLWQNFDNITRDNLSKILGVPVNNWQWSQAQLPVSSELQRIMPQQLTSPPSSPHRTSRRVSWARQGISVLLQFPPLYSTS